MQGNARRPLRVTPEAVDAFEMQTGFQGRGKIMVEHSVRVIVPSQGVIQPPWRPAGSEPVERQPAGNSVQRLYHVIAVLCNRANPAATWRGGAS